MVFLSRSVLQVYGSSTFEQNAGIDGGAIAVMDNSRVSISDITCRLTACSFEHSFLDLFAEYGSRHCPLCSIYHNIIMIHYGVYNFFRQIVRMPQLPDCDPSPSSSLTIVVLHCIQKNVVYFFYLFLLNSSVCLSVGSQLISRTHFPAPHSEISQPVAVDTRSLACGS